MLPYTVLFRTVPMLIILIFVSVVAAYMHVYLLWIFLKLVMVATFIFKQLILSLFVYMLGSVNVTFSGIKLMKKKTRIAMCSNGPQKQV